MSDIPPVPSFEAQAFEIDLEEAKTLLDTARNVAAGMQQSVLLRAGVILAITAWDVFVKDALRTLFDERKVDAGSWQPYIQGRFENEMLRLNTPNLDNIKPILKNFCNIDTIGTWASPIMSDKMVKDTLDYYIQLRGHLTHRGKHSKQAQVTIAELLDMIAFLEALSVVVADRLHIRLMSR